MKRYSSDKVTIHSAETKAVHLELHHMSLIFNIISEFSSMCQEENKNAEEAARQPAVFVFYISKKFFASCPLNILFSNG